jgi:hypothetical protein
MDKDRVKSKRAMEAMMQMVKLYIAKLEEAHEDRSDHAEGAER